MSTDVEQSLKYEELAFIIAGLPLVIDKGEDEGRVDRRLAFETAEVLGPDGVENLRRFADLVGEFSRLEGARTPPGTKGPGSLMRLEDLVKSRTDKVEQLKAKHPLMDEIWKQPNEVGEGGGA